MEVLRMVSLLASLAVTLMPDGTLACDCFRHTPQTNFCSNTHVLKIGVSKRNAAPEVVIADETTVRPATAEELANNMDYQETMYNRYKYNIRKVYKGDITGLSRYAYTPYHNNGFEEMNMCGSSLEATKSVIMATPRTIGGESALEFGQCSFTETLYEMDISVKNRLRNNKYPETCDCSIDGCWEEGCSALSHEDDNKCYLNVFAMLDCYSVSVCKRNSSGKCAWRNTKQLKECLA